MMETTTDIEILNYALTLEYLEADFYKRGAEAKLFSGHDEDVIKAIRDHEKDHVETLKKTIEKLGGKHVKEPKFQYPAGTFTDKAAFLKTASTFEELGVAAYHGQVTRLENPDLLAAAASIAGVESRHAAVLAGMMGGNPFPAPIEAHKTMADVLAAAKPFIVGSGVQS